MCMGMGVCVYVCMCVFMCEPLEDEVVVVVMLERIVRLNTVSTECVRDVE
jgi:hypothetical protein